MRILHTIYDDLKNPWLGGGGAIRTFEIYRRLSEKHEITVITGNYPNMRNEEREGILYKRVGSDRSYFLSRLSYSLATRKFIKKLDYDILVEDFSAYSPCLSPLHTKKPVIASIQNLYSIHAIKKYKFGVMPFLLENFGLKLFRNFIVVSPSLEEQLKRKTLDKCRVTVIPNGVDESLFLLKTSEHNFVLFLGRIDVYQKGLDTLLDAFKEVAKSKEETRLIIAGSGKDNNKLEKLISKADLRNVDYLGRVSDDKKKWLLSNCLFVCMPSRYEASPLVAFEAAACGKPVIGTKIPGLWDAVVNKETGILVTPNNPKGLYKAIMRLIEDEGLRKKLGWHGKERSKKYRWDEIVKTQEKFYFECITNT